MDSHEAHQRMAQAGRRGGVAGGHLKQALTRVAPVVEAETATLCAVYGNEAVKDAVREVADRIRAEVRDQRPCSRTR